MRRCSLLLLVLLWAAPAARASYEADFAGFLTEDAANPPPADVIIFTGSSSINGWPDLAGSFPGYPVRNRGFGGSVMTDVLEHYDELVTRYAPPLVVLYEGDNDLAAGLTPAQVLVSYQTFVARVLAEQPRTGIAILAVKPSPSRASLLTAMAELNAQLRALCDTSPRLRFIDVYTPMLNASGQPRPELFGSDLLHMNATGYQLWISLVEPVLAEVPFTLGDAVLVDFGATGLPTALGAVPDDPANHWNNVSAETGGTAGASVSGLVTADGVPTGIGLEILERFNSANEAGTVASARFAAQATRDSLFGNTATFNGLADVFPGFRLTGLVPENEYRLTFYASRTGGTTSRETSYTVTGTTTGTASLEVADNVDAVAVVEAIHPDESGNLSIRLAAGPGNTTPEQFTYLGALMIESTAPPPPDTTAPILVSGAGLSDGTLLLTFDEPLAAASAGPGAWTVTAGGGAVGVTAAELRPDGRSVILTLSREVAGPVLVTASGVQDLAGNPVAAGTSVSVVIPDRSVQAFFIDAGGTATGAANDPERVWNNLVAAGVSDTGVLPDLLTTGGLSSGVSLRMVRRFNGSNTNGTTASGLYPSTATGDSLFGNTETFSSLTNIFPAFRLTGLVPGRALDLTFYASRMGVSDNRSTRYTLTGAQTTQAVLNAANNIGQAVTVHNFRPDGAGEILIELAPAPANTNSNHFTYLSVLAVAPSVPLEMRDPVLTSGMLRLDWSGHALLEWADHPAGAWTAVQPAPLPPWDESVSGIPRRFYRLRERMP